MINQLLNPVLTQSTATTEEKVILTLEGTTIHSLNELREHFNRNEILSFYSDGRLLTWLCQHYYETQADRLRALDPADKNCFRKLCVIFDVNYPDHIEMSAEDRNILKAKEETLQKVLKDTGADQSLFKKLDIIAINQEELASDQKTVWRGVISGRIAARFPDRCPEEIRVLDVGTGPGFFAIILAELGYQVTAVDYTASMLEEARHNAGALAKHIHFQQMNAEKLAFQTASFDVLVTRNVTWNLHDPEKAYAQWMRVLKPGGVLLNFDANWYRYLYDASAQAAHLEDRANVYASGVEDDTLGTDVAAMEAIARRAVLSRRMRPAWDHALLRALSMCVTSNEDIWKEVWTEDERINNASTPMFLVQAVKTAAAEEGSR